MNVANLVTALTVIFIVSVIFLLAELFFILRHRHFFGPQSFQHSDRSPKRLLYFFNLKSQTRVEPAGAFKPNPNGCPPGHPETEEMDVFKLLESNTQSRVLCTIKEDDREEVESTSTSMDIVSSTDKVCLQTCLESEAEAERAVKVEVEVEGTKTVLSSPCDSPMFFIPMGTPSRDGAGSEFVSPV